MTLNQRVIVLIIFLLLATPTVTLAQTAFSAEIHDVTTALNDEALTLTVEFTVSAATDHPIGVTVWLLEWGAPLYSPEIGEVAVYTRLESCCDSPTQTVELTLPLSDLPQRSYDYSAQPWVRVWDETSGETLAHTTIGTTGVTPVALTLTASAPDADADGDGVLNSDDLCAGFIPGAKGTDAFGCPTQYDPSANLGFRDENHRRWYVRFWTGDCGELGFPCFSGHPSWLHSVDNMIDKLPAAEQGPERQRLWALGRMIGYEWSQNVLSARINTGHLQDWGGSLHGLTAETVAPTFDGIILEAHLLLRGTGRSAVEGGEG